MNKIVKISSIPFAVLKAFTAFSPVALTVALSGCNTNKADSSTEMVIENEADTAGGAIVSANISAGIKLTASRYTLTSSSASFSAGETYDSSEDVSANVCRLTAESDNDVALTAVTWKASWADKTIGFNVYNYISLTSVSADGLNVQLTVKKAFGYPIVITATSSDNANATGSVTINYVKRISSFSVSMGTISTVSVSNYSVNASSVTGMGTLSPKAVTYAYYIKFSSDFSDTAYNYISISKTMTGIQWYELISSYAKSEDLLENLTDNPTYGYVSIYVTATVTYGGETYQFLTSDAYYPSFTNVPKLDVTISDSSTSQDYSDSDSEPVSGEISEDGSITTEGSYDLEANSDYTFTADEDGTYTFTAGEDSSITIEDSSGNEWTLENGESADIDLSAGETLDIATNNNGELTIDNGSADNTGGNSDVSTDSGTAGSFGTSGSGNTFSTTDNEINIEVSGGTEDFNVSVSTELEDAVTITQTEDGVTITKNDDYADESVSGDVTITSGDQSLVINISFETTLTVSAETIELENASGEWSDIAVSGGNGSYSVELSSGLNGSVTYSWVDNNTLRLTYSYGSDVSGSIEITSGSQTIKISVKLTQPDVLCLTGNTLITMADGTYKRIDQITYKDKVLSIDPETSELCASAVTYTDAAMNKEYNHYDRFEFDDGTVITTVHRHRFYNVEDQRMIHIDTFTLGDRAYKQDGTCPKLVFSKEHYEDTTVKHYTLFCEKQNYFANGLLSGNRFTKEIHKGGKN